MVTTKLCKVCGSIKPLGQMQFGGKGYADGYKYLCRSCKNKMQVESRKRAKERDADIAKFQAIEIVKEVDDGRIPARTFVYLGQTYRPEIAYCRNDGLKHIQSRGDRT